MVDAACDMLDSLMEDQDQSFYGGICQSAGQKNKKDLYKAPGTSYSVDPGFWLTTISCLNQFTIRPVGATIPQGGKLITIRHQPCFNFG